MKRMPTMINGNVIMRIIERLIQTDWFILKLCMKTNGLNPSPIRIKIIPPIYSHFHATMSKMINPKDGIRCMRKSPICCLMVNSGLKASRANMLINKMARIQRILGIQ